MLNKNGMLKCHLKLSNSFRFHVDIGTSSFIGIYQISYRISSTKHKHIFVLVNFYFNQNLGYMSLHTTQHDHMVRARSNHLAT